MTFLKLVVFLVAVTVAAMIVAASARRGSHDRVGGVLAMVSPYALLAIVPLFVGFAVSAGFGEIQAGSEGVVTRFGAPTGEVKNPGFYVVMPFVTSVYPMDTQIRAFKVDKATASSRDLQIVTTDLTVNFHLDSAPASIVNVYTTLRDEYNDRVILPITLEDFKAIVAQYSAAELIDKRSIVQAALLGKHREDLRRFGIIVDDLNVTNFNFSDQYNQAIEAKVTAEQEALQAKALLQKRQYEAQQVVVTAEGQAKALALQRQALEGSPQLVELQRIAVAKAFVEKWDGKMPSVVGGGANILNLPSQLTK